MEDSTVLKALKGWGLRSKVNGAGAWDVAVSRVYDVDARVEASRRFSVEFRSYINSTSVNGHNVRTHIVTLRVF